MSSTEESRRTALHSKIADFHASKKLGKEKWKEIENLTPNIEEVRHRILASEFDTAGKIFAEIAFDYLLKWGHFGVVIELGSRLKDNLSEDSSVVPSILNSLGLAYAATNDLPTAVTTFEAAIRIASAQGKPLGSLLGNLGGVYLAQERYEKARNCHLKALKISQEAKNRRLEGDDLGNIGNVYFAEGDYVNAIEYQEQALDIAREVKNRVGEGNCLMNLGYAKFHAGEEELGVELMEQALQIRQEQKDLLGEAGNQMNLAVCYTSLKNKPKATERYEGALECFQKLGNRQQEANLRGDLGVIYLSDGDDSKAREHLQRAAEIFKENGDKHKEAHTMLFLSLAFFNLDRYKDSIEAAGAAADLFRETRDEEARGKAIGTMGSGYIQLGDLRNAYRNWKEAITILKAVGSPEAETFSRNVELNFPVDSAAHLSVQDDHEN